MQLGIIGAGMISDIYLKNLTTKYPHIHVTSIAAAHLEHAQKKAQQYHLKAQSVEEMLQDPNVELIVMLTPVETHEPLIRKALLAGKHVYTEKTITTDPATAYDLMKLAEEQHCALGAAPDTFLGASLQTARQAIDQGLIGDITGFRITATRDNVVALSRFPFLRHEGAGICYDYAVYYITALVSLLGAVQSTAAYVRAPYPYMTCTHPGFPDDGLQIHNPNESEVAAILQMQSGVSGTCLLNADTIDRDVADFVIFGTKGMLLLGNPNRFGDEIRFVPNDWDQAGERHIPRAVPFTQHLTEDARGIGVADMVDAIETCREFRANATLACHVLDVLNAFLLSGKDHQFHEIPSTCSRPATLTNQDLKYLQGGNL